MCVYVSVCVCVCVCVCVYVCMYMQSIVVLVDVLYYMCNSHTDVTSCTGGLVRSSGTLVVAPASLMGQWKDEASTKVAHGLLDIYIYHGPKRTEDPHRCVCGVCVCVYVCVVCICNVCGVSAC